MSLQAFYLAMVIFATLGPVACCLASYFLPDDHPHPFHEIDERAIEEGFRRKEKARGRKPLPRGAKVKSGLFISKPERVVHK